MATSVPLGLYKPANGEVGWGTLVRDSLERIDDRISDLVRNVKSASYGAKGDGTTNDSVAIQACIDAGPGVVYFPPAVRYHHASVLTIPSDVTLRGAGSGDNWDTAPSILRYTGAGSGSGLDCTGKNIWFEDLSISYTGGFTGTLVNLDDCVTSGLRRCSVSGLGSSTAAGLISLNNAILIEIDTVQFNNSVRAILGMESGGFSNVVAVRRCNFAGATFTAPMIKNCGQAWIIEGNAFEALVDGSGKAISIDSALSAQGVTFINNWCGDNNPATTGAAWIAWTGRGLDVRGNYFGVLANNTSVVRATGDCSGISIAGNVTDDSAYGPTGCEYLDLSAATALKDITVLSNSAHGPITNFDAGDRVGNSVRGLTTNVNLDAYYHDNFHWVGTTTPVVPDLDWGNYFTVTYPGGTSAKTIGVPTVGGSSAMGDRAGKMLRFCILNNSGGAVTTTWNAKYKRDGAWVDPANGKYRIVTFIADSYIDSDAWIEVSRTGDL